MERATGLSEQNMGGTKALGLWLALGSACVPLWSSQAGIQKGLNMWEWIAFGVMIVVGVFSAWCWGAVIWTITSRR